MVVALICFGSLKTPNLSVHWAADSVPPAVCFFSFLPPVVVGQSKPPHARPGNLTSEAQPERQTTSKLLLTHAHCWLSSLTMYLSPLHLHHSLHYLHLLKKLAVRFHGLSRTGGLLPHLLFHLKSFVKMVHSGQSFDKKNAWQQGDKRTLKKKETNLHQFLTHLWFDNLQLLGSQSHVHLEQKRMITTHDTMTTTTLTVHVENIVLVCLPV